MARIGVVLSGCGVYDGAEIYESVITLLALDRAGAQVTIMAPDVPQMHVVNHLTGKVMEGETRNVLTEAARIARGAIVDIAKVQGKELDALIFPGGFGGAKNLSTFAVEGAKASVNPDVARLVREMMAAKKPVGFICITPAFAAKIFQQAGIAGVRLTVGPEGDASAAISAMGADHVPTTARDIVIDAKHKIVSTAAYMCAASIGEAAEGIEKLVAAVLKMQ